MNLEHGDFPTLDKIFIPSFKKKNAKYKACAGGVRKPSPKKVDFRPRACSFSHPKRIPFGLVADQSGQRNGQINRGS
jgi:hypothetical protein